MPAVVGRYEGGMMAETRVVHVNSEEWRNTPEDQRVYIGRENRRRGFKASKWENPYRLSEGYTRAEVINRYRQHIKGRSFIGDIEELRGKVLGCWCKPEACHGDVLVEMLEDGGYCHDCGEPRDTECENCKNSLCAICYNASGGLCADCIGDYVEVSGHY